MPTPPASGVFDYDDLLKDEISAEDARKESLEQRGLAVITTSGVLVTLLFALSALSTKSEPTFDLSDFASVVLAIALALFVGAAVLALIVNQPMDYIAANPNDIEPLLEATPIASAEQARKDVALVRVIELRAARGCNGTKATWLVWAMALEVAAVVAVACAVLSILL